MFLPGPGALRRNRFFILVALNLLVASACSPPVERPKGAAYDFDAAKDMFKRNRFDRVLEFTDGQVNISAPNTYTERARVLRVVVLTGQIKAYKELADAYAKGVDNLKDLHRKGAYGQQRHDNLQLGGQRALNLAEVVQLTLQGGALPKEVTLETPYPSTDGPVEVRDLAHVADGGWIEAEQQEAAVTDCLNKAIDDTLAEIAGGDRSKVHSLLAAGPVKLNGVDYGLFVGKALLEGASLFNRKHFNDPEKFRMLANQADTVAKATLALLKDHPNTDKEKEAKDLENHIKTALKAG